MPHFRTIPLVLASALAHALVLGWSETGTAASTIVSVRNSSDPRARVFDGKLYLYTSCDLNQSGSWPMNKTYGYSLTDANADPGLASSWTDNGALLSESDYAWSLMANHLWAPDVFRGNDGKFYLYVPDTLKPSAASRVGVTVSSGPVGPFAPPSGFTTSNNYIVGGATYMSDPSVFEDPKDPTRQRYLVYADGGFAECAHISIAKLDQATSTISENQKIQWTNQSSIPNAGSCSPAFMEGPELGYFGGAGTDGNGKYFLYFAMKDNTSVTESIAYATADSVLGPYTYQGIIMNGQGGTGWTNQASIVEWQGHYLFFYHNDPKAQTYPNRQVFLECAAIQNGKISPITRGKYTTLSACPKASTGSGGQSGGSGGTNSLGGAAGSSAGGSAGRPSGGADGMGGSRPAGGNGPSDGGGGSTSGGSIATGGSLAAGGAIQPFGGSDATLGGAVNTNGGSVTAAGGNSNPSGGNSALSGGTSSAGTLGNSAGSPAGGASPSENQSSEGCGCRVAGGTNDAPGTAPLGLLVLGAAAAARRRRRSI